jgi:ubiquitin-conjugating enzyme E2 variant
MESFPAPTLADAPALRDAHPRRSRIVAAEAGGLVVFAGAWVYMAGRLLAGIDDARSAVLAFGAAAVALVAADLFSGLGHWLCDRYLHEDTPVLGPLLIRPFREHHREPRALVAHRFVELNGDSALVLLPVMGGAALAPEPGSGPEALFAHAVALVFSLAIVLTNSVHRWAHAQRVPAVVAWLQRRGLVLTPEGHALHHAGPHTRAYCITTGWCNERLDRIGFFPLLERALALVGIRSTAVNP